MRPRNIVFTSRHAVAIAAGLMLAASFPKISIAGFAWIAPAILLGVGSGLTSGAIFRLGYLGGVACYLAQLYWLLLIPVSGLETAAAVAGWIALAAYLALYPAFWAWLCWQSFPNAISTTDEYSAASDQSAFVRVASLIELLSPMRRFLWPVQCAAYWVALEMLVGRLFSGFPWDFLGVSQYRMLPITQIASFTGVYGVSFLVIWFSVSLLVCAGLLLRTPSRSWRWRAPLLPPLVAVCVVAVWGMGEINHRPQPSGRELKVALVQPSIPQTLIWNTNENSARFDQLIKLSQDAVNSQHPDVVIWPEAAVPNMLRHDPEVASKIQKFVLTNKVWMVVGSDDAVLDKNSTEVPEYIFYNSSFLISPRGMIEASYRKRQLVIFGEYIPFVRALPFLQWFVPGSSGNGFTSGERAVPFKIPLLGANMSVLICFEDTFPHLAPEYVTDDTDFLLNLTNNGWFGESAAQWQHAATAVFRAIENRVPLVRCANNGLTCWVDDVGRMHEIYFHNSSNVYQVGYKAVRIPLLGKGEKRGQTFYNRHGDLFGWACVLVAVVQLGRFAWGKTAPKKAETPAD
ncbi:MAG: Apolipoprotein N-acyltransferase [Verrucomicrobiales bacterium]|nr:Apolipoprotein N-acyltransferase [Verrucomicrobiales bacterium]